MRNYILYEIRNVKTNQVYVGLSGSSWAVRITHHLSLLRKGEHHAAEFQAAWHNSAGISDWSFRILNESIDGVKSARAAEAAEIQKQPEHNILNARKVSGVDWVMMKTVRELREQGKQYLEISKATGLHTSTICKIVKRYPPYN